MTNLFIQIGDIHLEDSLNPLDQKKDALFNAVKNHTTSAENIFLIITGDIANKGLESEYKIASKILDDLVLKLKEYSGKEIYVLAVPGNHDCDLSNRTNKARESIISLVQENGSEAVDDSIIDLCNIHRVHTVKGLVLIIAKTIFHI